MYTPAVSPELGAQRKFEGHAKKISGAWPEFVCAPNFKTM